MFLLDPCTLWAAVGDSCIGICWSHWWSEVRPTHAFPVVLWVVALVASAHRLVSPPCEPGNFLVLLMKEDRWIIAGNKAQLLDLQQSCLAVGWCGAGDCLDQV